MLRFAVYDADGPAASYELVHAALFGPGDVYVRGRVHFEDGHVVCETRGNDSVGLSLLHDAGKRGRLILRTCLLPPDGRTRLLTVELARQKIAMFVAKSEEWQMFDLSHDHGAIDHWERARERLVESMTSSDPIAADVAARAALEDAIEANERLAMAHADILLHRRYAERAASSSTLGIRVEPGRSGQALRDIVARDFDVLSVPLRWSTLEVEEGRYAWGPTDGWIDWARQARKPIVAGPLLDFSKAAVPEWMYVWQHDYDTIRDLAYDHVERVVRRYAGVVGFWNLAAGLNTNENFHFSIDQMCDLVRMTRLLVRQARPRARTMVEIVQPFGEHGTIRKDSVAPLVFLDRLGQEGIPLDAIGIRLLVGEGTTSPTRDLMELSALLDRYAALDMPILVSAMGAPSANGTPDAGHWCSPWSDAVQATWVQRVFAVAMSKPFVESVFCVDLFDHERALVPAAGLIDDGGRAKTGLARLVGLRRRLRKPLGSNRSPIREAEDGTRT